MEALETDTETAAKYAPLGHNHDAAYSPTTHNHDARYLPLAGGTMTGDVMMGSGKAVHFANTANTASTGWRFIEATAGMGHVYNGTPTGTYITPGGVVAVKGTVDIFPGSENLSGEWLHNSGNARMAFVGLDGDPNVWRVYSALPPGGNHLSINLTNGYVSIPGGLGVSGVITTTGGITGNGSVFNIASTANIQLSPAGNIVHPSAHNAQYLGWPGLNWGTVYTGSLGSDGQMSVSPGFHFVVTTGGGGWIYLRSTGHTFFNGSVGAIVAPELDNRLVCGGTGNRWQYVAAVQGGINTCRAEEKDLLGAVDPEWALDAILRTPIKLFHPKGDDQFTFAGQVDDCADPRMQIKREGSWTSPNHQTGMLIAAVQALAARMGVTA